MWRIKMLGEKQCGKELLGGYVYECGLQVQANGGRGMQGGEDGDDEEWDGDVSGGGTDGDGMKGGSPRRDGQWDDLRWFSFMSIISDEMNEFCARVCRLSGRAWMGWDKNNLLSAAAFGDAFEDAHVYNRDTGGGMRRIVIILAILTPVSSAQPPQLVRTALSCRANTMPPPRIVGDELLQR